MPIRIFVCVLMLAMPAMTQHGDDIAGLKQEARNKIRFRDKAAGAKVVSVDCTKGQKVQEAIDKNDGDLVVKIKGICIEDVVITLHNVTLQGTNPATDGITGADATLSAVTFLYASDGTIQNLSISNGPGGGVTARFSSVLIENSRITGNGFNGIFSSVGGSIQGVGLEVTGNNTGAHARRGGTFFCVGCNFANNVPRQAIATLGGVLSLLQTTVSGQRGIEASNEGSYADLDCVTEDDPHPCSLNVSGEAARAFEGTAGLYGAGDFTGRLQANGGHVFLYGSRQVGGSNNNNILDRGRLTVTPSGPPDPPLPAGVFLPTFVGTFSTAIIEGDAEINGNISCNRGGDAWRDPDTVPAPGVTITGCENASVP
jgi:hypothetical protein